MADAVSGPQATPGTGAVAVPPATDALEPRLSLAALPAALVVLLLLIATVYDGGFAIRQWSPAAVFVLVMLAAMFLGGGVRRVSGPIGVALAAIWALAGWTLLSITWSESAARAWVGGNRTIFYAALVTVALVAIPGARERRTIGALLIGGVTLLGAVTLVRMHLHGSELFVGGRLDTPAGYRNATACLFALAFWPLIGAAVTRGRNPTLRAGGFAAAVLMLGLAFVTQSRGALLALVLGGIVALALGTERIRRAFLALIATAGVAVLSGSLLTAYRAFEFGNGTVTVGDIATVTGALTFLVVDAFIVGLLLALLDGGLRASVQNLRRARRIAVVGLVVGTVGLIAGAVAAAGNPVNFVDTKLDEFQKIERRSSEVTRLVTTGGQRYDLWRVALDEFSAHPIRGVGEGGYAAGYYLERDTDRNLSDPHSLPLRLLAETGLVGAFLFAVFLVALAVAILAGVRGATLSTRHAVAGLTAAGVVVLAQALVDWIWLVPGVTGIGLICLALAAGIVSEPRAPAAPAGRARVALTRVVPAIALLAAAVSVSLVFLADFYTRDARAADSPEAALAAARTAEGLNPTALAPRYLQASALERLGELDAARAELLEALWREPRNFATLGLLGDLEVRAGDLRQARSYYADALALNPRDFGVRQLKRKTAARMRSAPPAPARAPTSRSSSSRG